PVLHAVVRHRLQARRWRQPAPYHRPWPGRPRVLHRKLHQVNGSRSVPLSRRPGHRPPGTPEATRAANWSPRHAAAGMPPARARHEAVERADAGYAMPGPGLGRALAGFAASGWNWDGDPASVTAVTDVGVGVVELLRLLARPGDAVVISPPVYPPFFDWVPEA